MSSFKYPSRNDREYDLLKKWVLNAAYIAEHGGGPTPPPPPPLLAFSADGYRATYDGTPPTFDPYNDPVEFSYNRSGFNASGGAISVPETITLMSRVRQPYPNQAVLTADNISLNDFIYAGDTIAGVTNNSTRAYPKPLALWLNRDLEIANSSTHWARLAVAHAYARNGKPVAAVEFIDSDGTNEIRAVIGSTLFMAYSATYNAARLTTLGVPHFAAPMDWSTLTQGATITRDAIIYPHVGPSFRISVDADVYPSPNLTTLRAYNNRLGTASIYYAYVNPADASGGTASTNPATAAADPFQTLALAAAAIKTARNGAGAGNNADLGIVRLVEADHTFSSISASNTATWPLIIEAADTSKKATTRLIAAAGASTNSSLPAFAVFRYITICRGSSSDHFMLDQTAAANTYTYLCAFEDCAFSLNGFDTFAGFINRCARTIFINCDGDDVGQSGIFGAPNKTVTSIGCGLGYVSAQTSYHAVACRVTTLQQITNTAARVAGTGQFFGWNYISASTSSVIFDVGFVINDRGIAIVGNIIESWGTSSNVALKISADGVNLDAQNVIVQMNTVVGQRVNALYLETAVSYNKSGYFAFNVFDKFNGKSDVFATQSVEGNWPMRYKAGFKHNTILRASNSGTTYDSASWLGDIAALGEATGTDASPIVADWVDDESNSGGDTGNGDYTPGASTVIGTIPAGQAPYNYDLFGNAIANDGTAHHGAVQQ